MLELFIASICAIALLYAPGFILFKALRYSNLLSLVAAPLASCAAYGLLPVIYYGAGIECNLLTIVVAPTVVFAAAFAVSCLAGRERITHTLGLPSSKGEWRKPGDSHDSAFDWAVLCLYLVCGIIVCSIIFIGQLGAPDAFFSRYDNQTHLNVAQSFLDSGKWSSLHAGRYLASLPNQTPYGPAGGFYPATWHAVVALICIVSGTKVTIASNALMAICAAIVFPSGMFVLIRTLFPNQKGVVLAGAFVTVGFSTYPWFFPIKGPTLPQMLAFAMMVSFMAILIDYLEQGKVRQKLLSFIIFSVVSFISLAIAHTNALFTAFVFLAAYGGHYLWKAIAQSALPEDRKPIMRIVAITLYCLLIIAFWALCITTPLLKGVVGYDHYENYSILRTMAGLVTMRFGISSVQFAMILLSTVGAIVCIRRKMWWLLIPAAYMTIAYFFTRTSYQPWLTIFAGLWYSLPYRAAECLCIFLMPIASLGLARICECCTAWASNLGDRMPKVSGHPQVIAAVVVVLLIAITVPPVSINISGRSFHTPFSSIAETMGTIIYGNDSNRVYGGEEVDFVDKAKELMDDPNALVINSPNDGSLFAYGVNAINTYFRGSAVKHQSDEAIILRTRLSDYSFDSKVKHVVEYTDAKYVLQLDHGVAYEDLIKLPQFYEKNKDAWRGVDAIDESTPGFTLLLSEGDMRFYRIDR